MNAQLELFAQTTVDSPLCHAWSLPCPRRGQAIYGPQVVYNGCVNRAINCLTCGCHGEESVKTEQRT